MILYFARHTRTAVEPGTCYGWLDVPLADSFATELETLRESMRASGIVSRRTSDGTEVPRIYSSPSQRCQQLARALTVPEAQTNSIVWDERLKELNFGDWEGRSWNEIQAEDAERSRHWMKNFVSARCPGGESYEDLARRVGDFLQDLAGAADATPAALIVAHGGSLRALLAHALGIALEHSFAFDVDYGRLSCLEWDPTLPAGRRGKLLYLNR